MRSAAAPVATVTATELVTVSVGVAIDLDGSAAGLSTADADLLIRLLTDLGLATAAGVTSMAPIDLAIRPRFVPNVATDQIVRGSRRVFT